MAVNYESLFRVLEEKMEEGIVKLRKTEIGSENYDTLVQDIVNTTSLIKNFENIGKTNNLKTPSKQIEEDRILTEEEKENIQKDMIREGERYEAYEGGEE